MTKVYFTKKHMFAITVIAIAILGLLLSLWLALIDPKRKQVLGYKGQLTTLKEESQKINQELGQLQSKPDLLESAAVKELPQIPNGITLEAYFAQLNKLEQELSLTFKSFSFNDQVIYPQAQNDGATSDTTTEGANSIEPSLSKQFRSVDISMEILSNNKANLLKFIDRLEKLERFLTIQTVDYRLSASEGETVSCSASLVARLYYLSSYETGKALSEK